MQCLVVVLGESSRNTASAAAQFNDRGTHLSKVQSKQQLQRPQPLKAQDISNSAFEDRVLLLYVV
jgi:hypothetical protein